MAPNFFLHTSLATLLGVSLSMPAASAAVVTQIPLPNSAYLASTSLLAVTGSDGDILSTLSDANLTVNFSAPLQKFIGSWGTWGTPPAVETSTPKVLAPAGANYQSVTSITLSFSTALSIFGVEVEPDAFTQGLFPVSLQYMNGVTVLGTLNNSLDGSTAALFAASSTTPITSVILTVSGNSNFSGGTDPAIAQLRYALASTALPEPDSFLTVAAGFALLAGLHRFRSTRV